MKLLIQLIINHFFLCSVELLANLEMLQLDGQTQMFIYSALIHSCFNDGVEGSVDRKLPFEILREEMLFHLI